MLNHVQIASHLSDSFWCSFYHISVFHTRYDTLHGVARLHRVLSPKVMYRPRCTRCLALRSTIIYLLRRRSSIRFLALFELSYTCMTWHSVQYSGHPPCYFTLPMPLQYTGLSITQSIDKLSLIMRAFPIVIECS